MAYGETEQKKLENKPEKKEEKTNKGPVAKHRAGQIEAAVWENEGKEGPYYTVSFSRNYKDKEGNWKNATNFRRQDLPYLEYVVKKAWEGFLK